MLRDNVTSLKFICYQLVMSATHPFMFTTYKTFCITLEKTSMIKMIKLACTEAVGGSESLSDERSEAQHCFTGVRYLPIISA